VKNYWKRKLIKKLFVDKRTLEEKEKESKLNSWVPKTKLGKLVKEGKIKDIDEILDKNIRNFEEQIVDSLLNLKKIYYLLDNQRVSLVVEKEELEANSKKNKRREHSNFCNTLCLLEMKWTCRYWVWKS
jgi:DNA-binding XRE family transcriptional regulator